MGLLLILMAAACNKEESPSQGQQKSAGEEDVIHPALSKKDQEASIVPQPKEVELVIYSNVGDPDDEIYGVYIDPLHRKYPHIRMKYIRASSNDGTTLPQLMANGDKFDIYYHGRGSFESTLLEFNIMYDMSDMIRKHNIDISHLEPATIESMREAFDGKIYGLPISLNSLLIYYNQALFEQFGVDFPKDGMTWDETFDLAKKMTRSEGQQRFYGFGSSGHNQLVMWNPYSIPLVDGKAHKPTIYSDERWRTIFQTVFLNPVMTEIFREAGQILNWSSFSKDRNLAMILYTASVPTAFPEDMKVLDWDMAALPTLSNLPGVGSQASPIYFGVTSLSTNPDAAMEALKYWTSIEFQVENSKQGKLMASRSQEVRNALGQDTLYAEKNWGAVTYHPFAALAPMVEYDTKVRVAYMNHLNPLLAGEMDLNTTLRKMEESAQQVISEHLSR